MTAHHSQLSPSVEPAPASVESCLPVLASVLDVPLAEISGYWAELQADARFLTAINDAVRDVAEFGGKQFRSPAEFRNYRCMLYLFTRVVKPAVFVETGVHNGLGSSFVLAAMARNGHGTLHSIDLPSSDPVILGQGNNRMPDGRPTGWIIPSYLRDRHELIIGRAQQELPKLLDGLSGLDVFLHDSDHSYQHMMFEMGLVWDYLRPGGWLLCDNIEANDAWRDYAAAMGGRGGIVVSFDAPSRVWKHGLLQR